MTTQVTLNPTQRDENFGHDKKIAYQDPTVMKIIHRPKLFTGPTYCCTSGSAPRKYLFISENGYEMNVPTAFFCCPANVCCPGSDLITAGYFDRGLWDKQSLGRYLFCCLGEPVIVRTYVSYYFLQDCTVWVDDHSYFQIISILTSFNTSDETSLLLRRLL